MGTKIKITSPLKYHGGKHYLASKIVKLMPKHLHYVEPYAGGLSVLLAKNPEGVSEVVNDLNGELTNFWRMLQGDMTFPEFRRVASVIPFSESEYKGANLEGSLIEDYPIESAINFFIRCRQSLAGRMKDFSSLTKKRVRRGMNAEASAWLSCIEGLPQVHERLKRVVILNRDALKVIKQQDGIETLFYLDPPYLSETRAATGVYEHEMTDRDHEQLLNLLKDVEGAFVLSGYRSEMYDDWAEDNNFRRHDLDLPNNSAGGKTKRRMTECLWCNF